ncbi:MAG: hypothetical protein KatS3mg027_1447 [Bacteroidia bacterium]|nr:MAG: hypothetical protein KatS3mg027_1447 [Bacteroidia bacterium]
MLFLSKNQIKFIKSLHQKKYRQEHQKFILEGEKLVNEALRDKPEIIEFIVVQNEHSINFNFHQSIPVYHTNKDVFDAISTLTTPAKILAVCNFIKTPAFSGIDLKNKFTFYLDNINDPGNLGDNH